MVDMFFEMATPGGFRLHVVDYMQTSSLLAGSVRLFGLIRNFLHQYTYKNTRYKTTRWRGKETSLPSLERPRQICAAEVCVLTQAMVLMRMNTSFVQLR